MSGHHRRARSSVIVLCCCIILVISVVFQSQRVDAARPLSLMSNDSTPLSDNQENYSNSGSWALGVVVPQNSQTDKGKVQWQNVVNVTVVFRAPNITRTDGTIYLVMSLMTSTGAVIQAAAGLYQNMSEWGTYGMDILHPSS